MKLVTRSKRFLDDASAIDMSDSGLRLRRFGDTQVPTALFVFDESEETLRPASVVWRVRDELGLRFTGEPEAIDNTERARLAGRYYAVR